jgi:Nucleotidyltransferase
VFRDDLPTALSNLPEDLEGAAIFGLDWLINSPRVEAVAIDERGYPVRLVAIDPRAFALHKAWVSRREDREPLKAVRDLEQAQSRSNYRYALPEKTTRQLRAFSTSKRAERNCAEALLIPIRRKRPRPISNWATVLSVAGAISFPLVLARGDYDGFTAQQFAFNARVCA